MSRQLRLGLTGPAAFTLEEFVRGPSNAEALAALEDRPWRGGCLALVGPEGSGKSHLAAAWAARAGALRLDRQAPDVAAADARAVLVEDADRGVPAEALFHLINLAAQGGALLLTARTAPATWPATLPDLRSRLNAMPVAMLGPPDDVVLEGVLRRFFRARNIRPPEAVYPYLLRRIGRSVVDAREIVRQLDEAGDAVTRGLARQVLDADSGNLDLFE